MTKEEIIEKLKQEARESWSGEVGEKRAVEIELFVRRMISNYSTVLGFSEGDILEKIEGRRDYSAINYYQEANFPALDEKVEIFETVDDLQAKFPSLKFVCPMCHGISTDSQTCNSGLFMDKKKKKVCDWKSYGLLGTLGHGYRFVIRHGFLEAPVVYDIFRPIEIPEPFANHVIMKQGKPKAKGKAKP